jgi:hypothetical protein
MILNYLVKKELDFNQNKFINFKLNLFLELVHK